MERALRQTFSAASNRQASPPVTGWRLCVSLARGERTAILLTGVDGKEQGGVGEAGDVDGVLGDGGSGAGVTTINAVGRESVWCSLSQWCLFTALLSRLWCCVREHVGWRVQHACARQYAVYGIMK